MFEANAFFPVDKELDQEEWPLMELTDATVFLSKRNNNTAELEDLLDVQDRGPFRIEGTLSTITDELKGIVRTKNIAKLYNEPLVITQVMMYSIQQFEDGSVKIWALGKCGWYSIIPSLEYEPIFETMVEKGKLWVFLQDRYCDKYSGKGNIIRGSVADLYLSYTKLETILPNVQSASQLFEKHYRYLLFEMCGVRADTDMWARTPLFRHFSSKYPVELRTIRRSMACASDRMDNPATVKKETSSAPSSPSPSASAQHLSGRQKVHNRSNSYTILTLFFENIAKRNLKPTEITKNLIAQFVNNYFVFESYQDAVANVDARAEDFLSIMEQPPLSMMYDWVETPAYKQLGFVRTSEDDMAVRQRKLTLKLPTQADHYYDEEEEEEEVGSVIGVGSVYIRSPVRPPAAAKGKSPTRVPVRLQTPGSETAGENDPEDTPAVVALNQKRVLDDLLSPRSGFPTAKRPRTRTTTTSSFDSSSSQSTLSLTSTGLQPGTNKPPCFATGPQATRTNSAGDLWECEISGCNHTIIDADSAESLQLIEEHYSEHAKVIKQAMDAIDGGKVLPSRPRHVNNLLAKIEQMARKWAVSSPAPLTPVQLGLSEPTPAQVVSRAEYLVTTPVTAHTEDPWTGHS